jgi:hypothetical protein
MTFVVARPSGTWEIRESRSTPAGPRARTLATFRALTPEILERAASRSAGPLDGERLRTLARRAGAPVLAGAADQAAGELLAELAAGRRPRPALQRMLTRALRGGSEPGSASVGATAAWVAATPQRRGETLRDLLLLADRLPPGRTASGPRFPRIRSQLQ